MEIEMRILGIDPGLRACGYGCLEVTSSGEKIIEAGVFGTESDTPLEDRLNQIACDIETLLEKFKPEAVAVEELYSHYDHPRTAILMGHARGVILQKCAQAGVKVWNFSATRIKKSVTGNGRASKEQVQRSIQTVLGLHEMPKPDHVADALAVAMCCANSKKFVEI